MDAVKSKERFEVLRFPQFILIRCERAFDRPSMHDFMKRMSAELKGHTPEGPLKFVALDLKQKVELEPDFFKVCRGLLTYFKQARLRFVALNCTQETKDFLAQSGMSKFIVPIVPSQLKEMQRSDEAPPAVKDKQKYLGQAWGDKVAEMITSLSPSTGPCRVVDGPAEKPLPDFQSSQVLASCNFQLSGDNFFLAISMANLQQLDIFKTCSTFPKDPTTTPENWMREFVNIVVHKVLRQISDLGHTAACQYPGAVASTALAREALKPALSLTLEFAGAQFSCLCVSLKPLQTQSPAA